VEVVLNSSLSSSLHSPCSSSSSPPSLPVHACLLRTDRHTSACTPLAITFGTLPFPLLQFFPRQGLLFPTPFKHFNQPWI
jgi:hypothetical protein